MSVKDLDFLKSNDINIYEVLDIPSDAQDTVIRKAYRKQALIYHPDKNSSKSSAERFHILSLSLKLLSNKDLRTSYDSWLKAKSLERIRNEQLNSERRLMKEELERAEKEAQNKDKETHTLGRKFNGWERKQGSGSSNFNSEVERLSEEGKRKRQQYEQEYRSKLKTRKPDQPQSIGVNPDSNRTVTVRWKIKEGITQYFNEDVLIGIMSHFGEVENCKILTKGSKGKKYASGTVTFKSQSSAISATTCDLSRNSTLWDSTSYKRLSKLLRDIEWTDAAKGKRALNVLDKDKLSFQEYKDLTLDKLKKFRQS